MKHIYWYTLPKKVTNEKDNFPTGLSFIDGPQGSGKTLTMVFLAQQMLKSYPDVRIYTNIKLSKIDSIYFNSVDDLIKCLADSDNYSHSLFLVDEGLSYFAENGGIDPALTTSLTTNRKHKRLILISSQKFKRLNNRLRDFAKYLYEIHRFLNFQLVLVRDAEKAVYNKQTFDFDAPAIDWFIFKRNNDLYNSYDTYQLFDNLKTNTQNLFIAAGNAPPVAVPAETRKHLMKGKHSGI